MATVYFTDMDGITTGYTVVAQDIPDPTAVEEMTAGDFDLTLFTCTYGSQSRVTVFCDREKADKRKYAVRPAFRSGNLDFFSQLLYDIISSTYAKEMEP